MAIKTYKLDDAKLATLKDQILLVLADYRHTNPSPLTTEGGRVDIANRVMANIKAVAARRR